MSSSQQASLSAATRRLAAKVAATEAALSAQEAELDAALLRLAARRDALQTLRGELAAARRAERECETEAQKQLVLAPLPTELVRLVFLLLPADARLRCREVCRGWCAFLADASLWRVCDLSLPSGVAAERTPALLQAATERAHGTLEVLDVTGWYGLLEEEDEDDEKRICLTVLLPVLHANAESLITLRTQDCFDHDLYRFLTTADIEALLAAAPRLRVLECDAGSELDTPANTLRLLEDPQFAPVHLQSLYLEPQGLPVEMPAGFTSIAQHASLSRLRLWGVGLDTEPALGAVVNLAVSQLQYLSMLDCRLSPASLPALTRLLGSVSLTELDIDNNGMPLLLGASMPAFCAALRASRLVELRLVSMCLWESQEDGLAVIAACTGHPTLRTLSFGGNGRFGEIIVAALDALEASIAELHVTR